MNKVSRVRLLAQFLTLLLIFVTCTPTGSFAAQPTVNLGTTSDYAVLAGSGISNTGITVISGDAGGNVGSSPTGTFTGQASVTMTGAVHLADAASLLAKTDLVTAYDDAAGRLPVTRIPTELGGTTLKPGVYDSADGTFQITGTLTLDAEGDPNGVFVFKTATTLITAANSNVSLINSARYCRTFWQVGSSATLGNNSHFVGHIFALASITANTNATIQGQLLARNGAVTLDNNTITNGLCPPVLPTTATLHVIKHVINDNGRTLNATNFNVHVMMGGADVAGSPNLGKESPGTTYTLAPGTYTVSENPVSGYIAIITGDSDAGGNITLVAGTDKTVTITNNDIPIPPPSMPTGSYTPSKPVIPVIAPHINVTKVPSPLAVTTGRGEVTYTYEITNPGTVILSNISISDDKVTPLMYISGDVNNDNRLQLNEKWIYKATTILTATTTNAVTVKGMGNGLTAVDVATATVVVSNTEQVVVVPPLINVVVVPNPLMLPNGEGVVTYTYKVTNPGQIPLSYVSLIDDQAQSIQYVSGDLNEDQLLQPSERWIYSDKETINQTQIRISTAKGLANGLMATDSAISTVVVSTEVVSAETAKPQVTHTVNGGSLPVTATPWYNLLLSGIALMILGMVGWKNSKF